MALKILRWIILITFVTTLFAAQPAAAWDYNQPAPDLVGVLGNGAFGKTIDVLPNGNFVVTDPQYSGFFAFTIGAVYLYNGRTHQLINVIIGSHTGDNVGSGGVVVLANGDYVVNSPSWRYNDGATTYTNAGAVTLCSATAGCSGFVSAANSLIGNHKDDSVGLGGVTPLAGGGYVVSSLYWGDGPLEYGAITACPPAGCKGTVSQANSLIGEHNQDKIGSYGVKPLPNGAYLVMSPYWDNGSINAAGALTYCPAAGCTGLISGNPVSGNSLVGTSVSDNIGLNLAFLTGGGYVTWSYSWDNGLATDVGAVTACPATGCLPGPVSAANSFIGSQSGDMVGSMDLGVTPLPNGGFVVASWRWSNGPAAHAGAVTVCPAAGCAGISINQTNSLVGSKTDDNVGGVGSVALNGGGYVVLSPVWSNGAALSVGAVTACPAAGCTGVVDVTNSLVGSQPNDKIGGAVAALPNGGFVVSSTYWSGQTGAVTVCPAAGCAGTVISALNSLVGSLPGDSVGSSLTVLADGSFVVGSPYWTNGGAAKAGAATHCPAAGCKGIISPANSLVGTLGDDGVGEKILPLANGQYLVGSTHWANGAVGYAGALSQCPASGCSGSISNLNSMVGSHLNDQIGAKITALPSGGYYFLTSNWDNGALADAGAATLCQAKGCSGQISAANSVQGGEASAGVNMTADYDPVNMVLIVGRPSENRVSFFTYRRQLFLPALRR